MMASDVDGSKPGTSALLCSAGHLKISKNIIKYLKMLLFEAKSKVGFYIHTTRTVFNRRPPWAFMPFWRHFMFTRPLEVRSGRLNMETGLQRSERRWFGASSPSPCAPGVSRSCENGACQHSKHGRLTVEVHNPNVS